MLLRLRLIKYLKFFALELIFLLSFFSPPFAEKKKWNQILKLNENFQKKNWIEANCWTYVWVETTDDDDQSKAAY